MADSIVIHVNNKEDLGILQEVAKRMGFSSKILSDQDKEDIGIAKAIQQNDPKENLSLQEAKEYYGSLKKTK